MTKYEADKRLGSIFEKHCNLSNENWIALRYEVKKLTRVANEVEISMDPVIGQMNCFMSVVDFMKRSKLITEEQQDSLKLLADEIYDDAWLEVLEGKKEEDGSEAGVGVGG